jgi:ATP phosphoribosyltransferase
MIAEISSRVIVNKAAMKTKYPVIKEILCALEKVVSAE